VIELPERPYRRKPDRLAPASQTVVDIILYDLAKKVGNRTTNLIQAMLLFGEDYVAAHTAETDEGVFRQAIASLHSTVLCEAQGGPKHDYEECPHRYWTASTRLKESTQNDHITGTPH
jgi:hypothetical protein